jgi:uncharacterized protein (DUF1800 family)
MLEGSSISAEQRPLHVLNRLSFGPRPGDIETVKRIGVEHWIHQQFNPDSVPESPGLEQRVRAMRTLRQTAVELFTEYQLPLRQIPKDDQGARKESRVVIDEAVEARIIRAIESRRQLQEVMTAFWFNHFNVFAGKGLCRLWTGVYEEDAIRPHALGRFRDLLGATAKHPAMLFYLDNWQNTAPGAPGSHGKFEGINENYARELMELHTLGVNGGYSQQDVIALAHILTGWGIAPRDNPMAPRVHAGMFRPRGFAPGFFARRWNRPRPGATMAGAVRTRDGFLFDPRRHDSTDKSFLGHIVRGDGIEEGETALDILARSPATANHLSFQLAQYFVADKPPPALVDRMTHRYLTTDGNLRDVLEIMIASPEFWQRDHYAVKFKTPYEFVISAVRATGTPVLNVRPLAGTMAQLGMPLYGCQTPDGYKNTQEAWLNPDAMMMRLSFATALGAGRLPLERPPFDFAADRGVMSEGSAMRRAMAASPGAGLGTSAGAAELDGRMEAPDAVQLAMTLGDLFSPRTAAAVEAAPQQLRAPLVLGSPEFMMR